MHRLLIWIVKMTISFDKWSNKKAFYATQSSLNCVAEQTLDLFCKLIQSLQTVLFRELMTPTLDESKKRNESERKKKPNNFDDDNGENEIHEELNESSRFISMCVETRKSQSLDCVEANVSNI